METTKRILAFIQYFEEELMERMVDEVKDKTQEQEKEFAQNFCDFSTKLYACLEKEYIDNGMTLKECVLDLNEEDGVSCLKTLCDHDISIFPPAFDERMLSFGARFEEEALSYITASMNDLKAELEFTALKLIEYLSRKKTERLLQYLTETISAVADKEYEGLCEIVCENIKFYGEEGTAFLTMHLKEKTEYTLGDEYLISILANMAKDTGNQEVYPILREFFKHTPNKGIAALILADYGNWRAISLLKNWIDGDLSSADQWDIKQVLLSIHALGGDISDYIEETEK